MCLLVLGSLRVAMGGVSPSAKEREGREKDRLCCTEDGFY